MRINNNMMAMNAHRQLGITNTMGGKSMEKLSSGFRINRAGDDAAGLAISEKMRGQIRGLNQASRNAQDGISLIQTAEGALTESHAILQRMRELAVQSANDTNTGVDRGEIQKEIDQLANELDRIANTTEFNTQKLLNGDKAGLRSVAAGKVELSKNTSANVQLDEATKKALMGDAAAGLTNGNLESSFTVTITKVSEATTAGDGFKIAAPNVKDADANITLNDDATAITIGNALLAGSDDKSLTINNLAGMKVGDSITINFQAFDEGNADVSKAVYMQIGANTGQSMFVGIDDMSAAALGVRTEAGGDAVNVESAANASAAVQVINNAIEKVSAQRSQLGAFQNRLEHTIKNLDTSAENLQASESRVRDVDMAKEMMEFTKQNILQQAATAMLAQANQAPQGVLQLLR